MRKFCLIALFIASYLTIGAQKCFQYPFNQGDAKWETFSSSKERIVALQIPEKTLTDIPTKELLITRSGGYAIMSGRKIILSLLSNC